ncbi:MAG TPA: multicopper oxidase domain-containing protein, partial [Kofleriaceae bacterium]|nr:multicopper oxidase domain-containing protein [Kofleriaceae bacterium]
MKLSKGRTVAGEPYTPVVVPNGWTLPFETRAGVKVFHLIAQPVKHEIAPGLEIEAWGYNGSTPGPLIECVEGDRIRIYVTNKLPEATSVHWHGVFVPNGMDGVTGLTQ